MNSAVIILIGCVCVVNLVILGLIAIQAQIIGRLNQRCDLLTSELQKAKNDIYTINNPI